jgi:hypothetical protein
MRNAYRSTLTTVRPALFFSALWFFSKQLFSSVILFEKAFMDHPSFPGDQKRRNWGAGQVTLRPMVSVRD